jgi:hypothetical protein
MRLERTPDKREVTGSTPVRPTVFSGQVRPAFRASRSSVGEVIPKFIGIRPTDKMLNIDLLGCAFSERA